MNTPPPSCSPAVPGFSPDPELLNPWGVGLGHGCTLYKGRSQNGGHGRCQPGAWTTGKQSGAEQEFPSLLFLLGSPSGARSLSFGSECRLRGGGWQGATTPEAPSGEDTGPGILKGLLLPPGLCQRAQPPLNTTCRYFPRQVTARNTQPPGAASQDPCPGRVLGLSRDRAEQRKGFTGGQDIHVSLAPLGSGWNLRTAEASATPPPLSPQDPPTCLLS